MTIESYHARFDAEHLASMFPNVIERWECPKHGQTSAVRSDGCALCYPDGTQPTPVLRRYVLENPRDMLETP
jgi:hypothetical protein